jgi:GDP/UDP-N,N'-diacetylbacillosamine 2-epimerase (hydrolysing)
MMPKRKICVITGTRAEYGLLYWIMKEIEATENLQLQIVVTGMHLSPEFGLTYKQIEEDGFSIDDKVEMLLSSDTPAGISKSMGVAMIGFADCLEKLQPDILVVLGDRFELLSAVSTALVARIPVAHLHGGEQTQGAFDEAIRHAITKMSHLHFTSTEQYRKRVVQLGEHPGTVFNVGATGIDNINKLKLLTRSEFEESIQFDLAQKNLLITFHPVTLENASAAEQFGELLAALQLLEDTHLIFTMPNADTHGRVIMQMIHEFVQGTNQAAVAFQSLGQLRYLSAMQFVDGVIGNSSSGIIEVPSFRIGTINLGDRQKGRIRAESIIDCEPERKSVTQAIYRLYSREFQESLKTVVNPHGDGGAAVKIVKELSAADLNEITKKEFYDIEN